MNRDDLTLVKTALRKIEKELREALHRTPPFVSSKQHIYNAYQLLLGLENILEEKEATK
jgi:hypothetical protein